MSRIPALLLVLIGLVVSCSQDRIELGEGDTGRTITVGRGDAIDITLSSHGSGAYGTPDISSASIRFVGEHEVAASPGGSVELFQFEAVSSGQATVVIPHTTLTSTFTIQVTVSP